MGDTAGIQLGGLLIFVVVFLLVLATKFFILKD
jgi:hypothetical protein